MREIERTIHKYIIVYHSMPYYVYIYIYIYMYTYTHIITFVYYIMASYHIILCRRRARCGPRVRGPRRQAQAG